MKRYADEVVICYDADEAGQKATARAISILRNAGLLIRVLTVPSGKDPDEFIKSKGSDGPAAFKAILDKSGNDVDYRLQKLKSAHNLETTDGKVAYLEEASKLLATINSPIERDVYATKICNDQGVDKNSFVLQLSRISKRNQRDYKKKEFNQIQTDLSRRNDKINNEHYKKPRSSSAEESLVVYLINNPDSAGEISSKVKPEQFKNSLMKRYFEYIMHRLQSGLEPLTNVAADFTTEETSKLFQMLSQAIPATSTRQAMTEYINVINEESSKISPDDVAKMSAEEIKDYLEKLRKNKQ